MPTILLADPIAARRALLRRALEADAFAVGELGRASSLGEICERGPAPELILLDVEFPGARSVLSLLAELPDAPGVLVLTPAGEVEDAMELVRAGALDLVRRPVDRDVLRHRLRRELEARAARRASRAAHAGAEPEDSAFPRVVGRSPAMQELAREIWLAAEHERPVLLHGESGTGKTLLARAIHRGGRREREPLLELDGSGDPGDWPAVAGRGSLLVRRADRLRGTAAESLIALLLSLPPGTQRLMATVGPGEGPADRRLDPRLGLLGSGPWIAVPALRERHEDIPRLARFFLARFAERCGQREVPLSAEAAEVLRRHPWPGNVRELRRAVEHGAMLAGEDALQPRHLLLTPRHPFDAANSMVVPGQAVLRTIGNRARDRAERVAIESALLRSGGNLNHAASLHGIDADELAARMKELAMAPDGGQEKRS